MAQYSSCLQCLWNNNVSAQLPTGDQGKGEEESTGPNMYDYNDSFINDESQAQSGNEKSASESEGSASDEEEDIKQLKKEAKKFVKNEKLTKPV
jgi:aprataxin and PNK-like factor